MKSIFSILLCLFFLCQNGQSQYTQQDSLRGSITEERAWWDLNYYHLDIIVNPGDSTIKGKNTVKYTVLETSDLLQIDLQRPMNLMYAIQDGDTLSIESKINAHFIHLTKEQKVGEIHEIELQYGGKPRVARMAPWDGGLSWSADENGKPWVATSCQGLGASVWWPCKDHMYDEVDSMMISVNVPDTLMDVSNGTLLSIDTLDNNTNTYHWFVSNPINNYGVNINIGDYVHFGEIFEGYKGPLACDYYVLRDDEEKAREQFKDAIRTLTAFEYWFGPYPFYEDGYKLVHVPYLGMEHQSSVTYGNGFNNGYLGYDLSGTGWGMKFDFIIIHETGHEWFANNVTYKDIADMWIHEGFTAYSENLFVDYFYGKEASAEYVIGTRKSIANDRPIIGDYNVNQEGSGDMYYKGANMLHTLRNIVDNDSIWRSTLWGLNYDFYHQTVTTEQVESYISEKTGLQLTAFFDQYLRETDLPTFQFYVEDDILYYRWSECVDAFDMPVKLHVEEDTFWLYPKTEWHKWDEKLDKRNFYVDENFLCYFKNQKP